MRYFEFFEGKSNYRQPSTQPRGLAAVVTYIESATPEQRDRMLVHFSAVPKVGIKPFNRVVVLDDAEPAGIYTYSADTFYNTVKNNYALGYGAGMPYVSVITLKPNTKILNAGQYDEYVDDFKNQSVDIEQPRGRKKRKKSDQYHAGSDGLKMTQYFRRLGFGVVSRNYEDLEYIVLDPTVIENIKMFQIEFAPKGTRGSLDPMGSEYEYTYPLTVFNPTQLAFIKKYRKFFEYELETRLYRNSIDIGGPPRELAAIKLLIYALMNQRELSPAQVAALKQVDNQRSPRYGSAPEDESGLVDMYEKYVLQRQPIPTYSNTDTDD